MKKIKVLIIALVAVIGLAQPASAQFKWGLQLGMDASNLSFSSKTFDSDNRLGITGGITVQYNFIMGLGIQASLLYTHRSTEVENGNNTYVVKGDYLALPVHAKYNISIPAVSNIIRPFIFTGPSFSYLFKQQTFDGHKTRKGDVKWDLGVGLDLFNRVQVSAGYGFGFTKMFSGYDFKVRQNCWNLSVGYLF